jgi:hypothetical protein
VHFLQPRVGRAGGAGAAMGRGLVCLAALGKLAGGRTAKRTCVMVFRSSNETILDIISSDGSLQHLHVHASPVSGHDMITSCVVRVQSRIEFFINLPSPDTMPRPTWDHLAHSPFWDTPEVSFAVAGRRAYMRLFYPVRPSCHSGAWFTMTGFSSACQSEYRARPKAVCRRWRLACLIAGLGCPASC